MVLRIVAEGARKSVQQLAQEKWRSSGISDQNAKRLHLRGLSGPQVLALGANFLEAAALYIPYFDLHGRKTKFFRIRYLEALPGFAGQAAKPQRFAQEIRALNEVYLPPLFKKPWEAIAGDKEIDLYITEGELKAAAGAAAGLATVGIGGVDVWRSARRGITLLPVLGRFEWGDRVVCIVYDSDIATKPDVVRAQRALAQELLSRGSRVEIVNIPPGQDGKKQGMDDFLVAQGADALKSLVEHGAAFPESDALWSMNEKYVAITKMGMVVERKSGDMIEAHRFKTFAAANRHYMETVVKGSGAKAKISLIKKQLAPHWIEWEQRAEMERALYEPGKPQTVCSKCSFQLPHAEHDQCWNVWPGWGCEPKKGDIGPYQWLMDFLFKGEDKIHRWFERWLAYPIQHPGTKLYAATLLWSREQRMGKTLLMYALRGIYGKNFVEVKGRDLTGSFNYWAKNRQFVYADEINTKESRIDTDWIKGVVTQGEVTIKEKFLADYVTRDSMNWAVASNHPDSMFLEDLDKRWLIHEVLGRPAEREKYEMVDKWLHAGGASHLFRHLLDLNLGDFNPREHAPDTPGKRSMIMLGKTDAAYWVQLLKEDAEQALKPLAGRNPGVPAACDLFTPTQLYHAFDPERRSKTNEAGLGRALAAAGFRQLNHSIGIRTSLGLCRLYAVRDPIGWEQATRKEIVDHFDKFWAPDAPEKKI